MSRNAYRLTHQMALIIHRLIRYTWQGFDHQANYMINLPNESILQTAHSTQLDHELEMITGLTHPAGGAAISLDNTAIINMYVALKSKPLAILTGPKQTGKIELIHRLAHILTESENRQYQVMAGHPWSFEKSQNVALFTEAQTRFNTDKLLAMVEEAWRPENACRVFIACITRISPAELLSFFTEVAYQIRNRVLRTSRRCTFFEASPIPSKFIPDRNDGYNFFRLVG